MYSLQNATIKLGGKYVALLNYADFVFCFDLPANTHLHAENWSQSSALLSHSPLIIGDSRSKWPKEGALFLSNNNYALLLLQNIIWRAHSGIYQASQGTHIFIQVLCKSGPHEWYSLDSSITIVGPKNLNIVFRCFRSMRSALCRTIRAWIFTPLIANEIEVELSIGELQVI